MSHPSSIQLEDTEKLSKSSITDDIDTPPPDYDAIYLKDGEKSPSPVPLKRPLKRAPPLEAPVDQVTYHGLDVNNLLASSRLATEKALEEVDVHSISSSRSSLSMTGGVSREFSNSGSEDGEEEEEEKEGKEQEEKGKRAKRRKLKKTIKGEMEDAVDANVVGTVEGNLDGFSDASVSYMVTPHPSFVGPIHTISFSVSDPESPRQDLSPV